MGIRKNSKSYKIVKYLLLGGGFLLVSSITPVAGAKIIQGLVSEYIRKKKFERYRFLRDLKRLQVRKIVDYQEMTDGSIKLVLTKKGEKETLVFELDELKLDKSIKWDGKWRLVAFDIPDSLKDAREALRKKLKQMGFHPIQKSVFLTPYECEKEIDFVSSVFEIRDYVLIFYVSNFEGDEKFRHHFKV